MPPSPARPARPRTHVPLPLAAFLARLRDLLGTVESAALIGSASGRVRGLGEHLRFACLAIKCDVAYVALEVEELGRLRVPAVATRSGYRGVELDFLPSGTPFAYLLGGGSGHVTELLEGDAVLEAIGPELRALEAAGMLEPDGDGGGGDGDGDGDGAPFAARSGAFVALRLGDRVIGGVALLARAPLGDQALEMAERLAEVLALSVEAFRTERLLFELFARALPDVLGDEATTGLPAATERALRSMRLEPAYRRRLELAGQVGRLAERGPLEAALAGEVIASVERYAAGLATGEHHAGDAGDAGDVGDVGFGNELNLGAGEGS